MNEEKIIKYGYPPAVDTRVFICGLPGVYEKLCGYRDNTDMLDTNSILYKLGYTCNMIVKL